MNGTLEIGADWREDYDWKEVFDYAKPEPVPPEASVRADAFCIDDVEEVYSAVNGQNDGDDWVMVGRLKDGRFFMVAAYCDYTGWG